MMAKRLDIYSKTCVLRIVLTNVLKKQDPRSPTFHSIYSRSYCKIAEGSSIGSLVKTMVSWCKSMCKSMCYSKVASTVRRTSSTYIPQQPHNHILHTIISHHIVSHLSPLISILLDETVISHWSTKMVFIIPSDTDNLNVCCRVPLLRTYIS